MKKTRILSLLLSALMAVSCLPITAGAATVADEKTPVNVNLFADNIMTSTTGWSGLTVTPVAVNDTYLFLDAVKASWDSRSLKLNVASANNGSGLVKDTEYLLKIDARAQIDGTESDSEVLRVKAGATNNNTAFALKADRKAYGEITGMTFKMDVANNILAFTLRGGNSYTNILPKEFYGLQIYTKDGATLLYEKDFSDGLITNESWNGETVTEGTYITVSKATAAGQSAVYTPQGSSIKLTAGEYELTFDARQSYFFGNSIHNATEYAAEAAKGNIKQGVVKSDKNGGTVVAATIEKNALSDTGKAWYQSDYYWYFNTRINNTLVPTAGTYYHILYQGTDSGSNALKDSKGIAHANNRDIKLTLNTTGNLKSNGANFTGATFNADTRWDSFKYTFTVPKGETVTLNSISFGGTDKAYDNDAFDISKLSLKLVEPYFDKVATPISYGLLANESHNGTVVEADYSVYDKNGYITSGSRLPWFWNASESTWQSNMFEFNLPLSTKINTANTYAVSFRVRNHVPSSAGNKIEIHIPASYVGRSGYFEISNEWKDYTFSCKPTTNNGADILFQMRRNLDTHNGPVDIDDVTIWIDANNNKICDDGAANIIYSENYNDPDKTYIGNGYGLFKMTPGSTTYIGSTDLYHNFDIEYAKVTGNNCKATYSGLNSGNGIASGIYKFSADLSIPYHYAEDPHNCVKNINGEDAAVHFAYNDHDVDLAFTLTPVNGGATVTKTVSKEDVISAQWSNIEAAVVVDEGYTLTDISIIPKFDANANIPNDKKALYFRNVDMKLVSPLNTTVNTGDTENFLNNAVEDYNRGIYTEEAATGNGYVSIGRRPWSWDSANNVWAAGFLIANMILTDTVESGYNYYTKFDLRHSVPTNGSQDLYFRWIGTAAWGNKVYYAGDDWNTYTYPLAAATAGGKAGTNFQITIRRATSGVFGDIPVDIDNLVIWKEPTANSDGKFTDADASNVLYSSDFNDPNGVYVGTSSQKDVLYNTVAGTTVTHTIESTYGKLTSTTENAAPKLSYTDLNNGEGHEEGIYAFSADFRLPYYYFIDASAESKANGWTSTETHEEYYALNDHQVKITFYTTDTEGANPAESVVYKTASYEWSSMDTAVIVGKDRLLTGIDIEPVYNTGAVIPADKKALDFKNVRLYYSDYPVVETEDPANYLADTTIYVENALPTEVKIDKPTGYLYISARGNTDAANPYTLATINTNAKIESGKTYYVDFDVTAETGAAAMVIRPTVNVSTVAEPGVSVSSYLNSAPRNELTETVQTNWVLFTFNKHNEVQKFRGQFTATSSTTGLVLRINKGPNANYTSALSIDNLRIYYKENNGEEIDVYNNNFDFETAGNGITATSGYDYTVTHVYDFTHTVFTPIDSTKLMKINYDIKLTDEEAVEGKYTFSATAKLAKKTDKDAKIGVVFNFDDGTSETYWYYINDDWTVIGQLGRLGRTPKLVDIDLILDSDVPVILIEPSLTISYKYANGKPNTGIVMILIKKMQGKFTDPWKQIGIN